jgi:hypothetical protein
MAGEKLGEFLGTGELAKPVHETTCRRRRAKKWAEFLGTEKKEKSFGSVEGQQEGGRGKAESGRRKAEGGRKTPNDLRRTPND